MTVTFAVIGGGKVGQLPQQTSLLRIPVKTDWTISPLLSDNQTLIVSVLLIKANSVFPSLLSQPAASTSCLSV